MILKFDGLHKALQRGSRSLIPLSRARLLAKRMPPKTAKGQWRTDGRSVGFSFSNFENQIGVETANCQACADAI